MVAINGWWGLEVMGQEGGRGKGRIMLSHSRFVQQSFGGVALNFDGVKFCSAPVAHMWFSGSLARLLLGS